MSDVPGSSNTRIIVLGATSAIAMAALREWSASGAEMVLVARDGEKLTAVAQDLEVRGGNVHACVLDLTDSAAETNFEKYIELLGGIDVVLLAYGELGDQETAEADIAEADRLIGINFTSAARWCLASAAALERQRHGSLVVIGSVAGDRGRASNYIYGAAKGGLGVLVQGLAHRLAKCGAKAVLIKPGFVDTPMTSHIENRNGPLWAQPETIARTIVKVAQPGKHRQPIVYAPAIWKPIMLIIRLIPSWVFHRTKL